MKLSLRKARLFTALFAVISFSRLAQAGTEDSQVLHQLLGASKQAFARARYDVAAEYLSLAYKLAAKDGSTNKESVTLLNQLAMAQMMSGDYTAALTTLTRALESSRNLEDPAILLTTYNNLASLYRDLGDFQKAADLFAMATELAESASGVNVSDVAALWNNYGELLLHQGHYTEAQSAFEKAYQIWRQSLGPHSPEVAVVLNNFGALLAMQKQYYDAEPYIRRALEILVYNYGKHHPEVAKVYSNLGALHASLADFEGAERQFRRALDIIRMHLDRGRPDFTPILINLAETCRVLGKLQESEIYYKQSIDILEHVSAFREWLLRALEGYSELLKDMGRGKEARSWKKKLEAIKANEARGSQAALARRTTH